MSVITAAIETCLTETMSSLSLFENAEIESVGHGLIACIVRVDVITWIELLF